jgi:glycosyltransferase involved in cell wall biosynthesis
MARPRLSVIVPVRDGARTLPALLDSLDAQTLAREQFEVIVVDNASRDATAQIARSRGATVVHEPRPNRSRARNRGASAARGSCYAFTDADCRAAPGWLAALLDCAGRAPLVAGEIRVLTGDPPNAIERFEALWRYGQEVWVRFHGWAATANLLVDAGAFAAIGGFDPAWRHIGEDADFCLRARVAGFRLEFCPDAVVEHLAERRPLPMLRRLLLHGYSANQAVHRIGVGNHAWRAPGAALRGDRALRELGQRPELLAAGEWRRMARLARLGHAARIAGSLWAEATRAR